MKDHALPAAKRMGFVAGGKRSTFWSCYNCKARLVGDSVALQDREVWTCVQCGHRQVLGRGVVVDALRKAHNAVAVTADEQSLKLPPNLNPEKLALIQQTYDERKKKIGKAPSQSEIYRFSGVARSTVREYWPFLRK